MIIKCAAGGSAGAAAWIKRTGISGDDAIAGQGGVNEGHAALLVEDGPAKTTAAVATKTISAAAAAIAAASGIAEEGAVGDR